jgi:hypothetical protein
MDVNPRNCLNANVPSLLGKAHRYPWPASVGRLPWLCKTDAMLIDIDTGKVIGRIPYLHEFDALRRRLSEAEFDAMVTRISELIDEAGSEIATAGWLPGSDWTGTPFEPIYAKAARGDFDRSAMFFGQLVWHTVMTRPERWGSGRYQLDGTDIGSRTSGVPPSQVSAA